MRIPEKYLKNHPYNLLQKIKPRRVLFFGFFMLSVFLTPLTVLFELDLSCDEFLVLATPVVYALTGTAGKTD